MLSTKIRGQKLEQLLADQAVTSNLSTDFRDTHHVPTFVSTCFSPYLAAGTNWGLRHECLQLMQWSSVVADSDRLEHQLEEAVLLQQDFESSASKLKMLEKQVKILRQEKDEVHKVVPRSVSSVRSCSLCSEGLVCLSSSCLSLWSVSGVSPRS